MEPNCIKVSHLLKFNNVGRHLDNILIQISKRVGPIARVMIFQHGKKQPDPSDNDTVGFIQLQDHTKHMELAYLLNNYNFHGKSLKAKLANFRFDNIDDNYYPREVECPQCANYTNHLQVYEENVKSLAIHNEINKFKQVIVEKKSVEQPKKEMVCPSNEEWLRMKSKDEIQSVESSEFVQVEAELSKVGSIEVLNNLDSLVMVGAEDNQCCVCGKVEMDGIKPTFRRVKIQKEPCPHWYCKCCFNSMICVNFLGGKPEWDGYAMVSSYHRFKNDAGVVFSCQLCKMV
jgi:hypothetical protein